MELRKTTKLPTGDQAESEGAFRKKLKQDQVLFVVLGDSEEAGKLAQLADDYAGEKHEPRWVVWASRPHAIAAVVKDLPCSGVSPPSLTTPDKGFTVSMSNTVMDVIRANEPEPDDARVVRAFAKAEGGE